MIKYIKYYLKFIEKFIYPFEAQPIVKTNKIDQDNVTLAINTKKNKKKLSILLKEHRELVYFQILYLY